MRVLILIEFHLIDDDRAIMSETSIQINSITPNQSLGRYNKMSTSFHAIMRKYQNKLISF